MQTFYFTFYFFYFLYIHLSGVLTAMAWRHMKLQPPQRKSCVHHTTMHHVISCKATHVRCTRV